MPKDALLESLRREGRKSVELLAEEHGLSVEAVAEQIQAFEAEGLILGYQAVIDSSKTKETGVTAFIEVKCTPERGGGFDRLANRIAKFDQVVSCYLASGGYDLLMVVQGNDLMEVARFVSEKLSSMEGVLSTATHFRLKVYKEKGFIMGNGSEEDRLPVSP